MIKSIDFSFKRNERIKRKFDFNTVFANGREVRFKFYKCKYVKNNLPNNRIGIIIRKRTVDNSIERNYEKRIIREFYRTLNKLYLHEHCYDIIIIQMNKDGDFSEKKKEFERILRKIRNNENK